MATSGKDTGIVGYNVQTAVDTKNHLPGYLVTPFGWAAQPLAELIQAGPELLTHVFELDRVRMHVIALALAHLDEGPASGLATVLFRGSIHVHGLYIAARSCRDLFDRNIFRFQSLHEIEVVGRYVDLFLLPERGIGAEIGGDRADIGQQFAQRLICRLEIGLGAALDPIELGQERDAELAVERRQAITRPAVRSYRSLGVTCTTSWSRPPRTETPIQQVRSLAGVPALREWGRLAARRPTCPRLGRRSGSLIAEPEGPSFISRTVAYGRLDRPYS